MKTAEVAQQQHGSSVLALDSFFSELQTELEHLYGWAGSGDVLRAIVTKSIADILGLPIQLHCVDRSRGEIAELCEIMKAHCAEWEGVPIYNEHMQADKKQRALPFASGALILHPAQAGHEQLSRQFQARLSALGASTRQSPVSHKLKHLFAAVSAVKERGGVNVAFNSLPQFTASWLPSEQAYCRLPSLVHYIKATEVLQWLATLNCTLPSGDLPLLDVSPSAYQFASEVLNSQDFLAQHRFIPPEHSALLERIYQEFSRRRKEAEREAQSQRDDFLIAHQNASMESTTHGNQRPCLRTDEIAELLGTSYNSVYAPLNDLVKYDLIERVKGPLGPGDRTPRNTVRYFPKEGMEGAFSMPSAPDAENRGNVRILPFPELGFVHPQQI